jgi:hypothetical protein
LIIKDVQAILQARDFGVWLVLSAQFLATSIASIPAALPAWLFEVYTLVSFFVGSPSYVAFDGCEAAAGSGYRLQAPLAVLVFVWLLVVAQPILLCASRRRMGVVQVVGFSYAAMNALYSVVAYQCFAVLACSGSVRTGVTVATTSMKILPDGTTFTETLREAVVMQ